MIELKELPTYAFYEMIEHGTTAPFPDAATLFALGGLLAAHNALVKAVKELQAIQSLKDRSAP